MRERAILVGDFNMTASEADHGRIAAAGLADTWVATGNELAAGATCDGDRIDFAFATADLAAAAREARIDEAAVGSDHQPIHVRFG